MSEIEKNILLKTQQTWDGTDFPAINSVKPEVTVLRIDFPANSKLPMHKHPMINICYLAKGTLTIVKESGEKLIINEGEAVPEIVDTYHYGETGDSPAQLIVFYIGEKDTVLSEE